MPQPTARSTACTSLFGLLFGLSTGLLVWNLLGLFGIPAWALLGLLLSGLPFRVLVGLIEKGLVLEALRFFWVVLLELVVLGILAVLSGLRRPRDAFWAGFWIGFVGLLPVEYTFLLTLLSRVFHPQLIQPLLPPCTI